MVLPFAGAEILFLGYCVLGALRYSSVRETITITNEKVLIDKKGRRNTRQSHCFQKVWVQVVVKKPTYCNHPDRLVIRSHGWEIELGRFLVAKERKAVAKKLEQLIR